MHTLQLALKEKGIIYQEQAPLKQHTSFKIGGPIDLLVFPKNEVELSFVLEKLVAQSEYPLILGNGSNILAADTPIKRVGIKMERLSEIRQVSEHCIYAQSGALLSQTANFAKDLGLSGLEFAHGIPGSVGGAIYMNAGAYEGDMGQVVTSVRYIDTNQNIKEISGTEAQFSYRHSYFSGTKQVILGAEMRLQSKNTEEIASQMRELSKRRKASQPLEFPSAGSTFKRPVGAYAAALIDQCGLKGYAIGGAAVSAKHAGFIINQGGASCEDVKRLMAHVQEVVLRETGYTLEPEVQLI